jgi:hypothetical protein
MKFQLHREKNQLHWRKVHLHFRRMKDWSKREDKNLASLDD